MTSQNRDYSEQEPQAFDYLAYEGKASEVGRGLSARGYLKLREVGFPDDPEIIKKYFQGQFDNEEEAVKAWAEELDWPEHLLKVMWKGLKEVIPLRVEDVDGGGIIIYTWDR